MPRRRVVAKREILPDPKFHNQTVAKFINHVMVSGKKAVAERIVYGAFDRIQERGAGDPVEVFDNALETIAPLVEVKSRRVGGATYQVPIEVTPKRRQSLAIRQVLSVCRGRGGKPMAQRLADEVLAAYKKEGASITWRENTHKMAEANKLFAHYAW